MHYPKEKYLQQITEPEEPNNHTVSPIFSAAFQVEASSQNPAKSQEEYSQELEDLTTKLKEHNIGGINNYIEQMKLSKQSSINFIQTMQNSYNDAWWEQLTKPITKMSCYKEADLVSIREDFNHELELMLTQRHVGHTEHRTSPSVHASNNKALQSFNQHLSNGGDRSSIFSFMSKRPSQSNKEQSATSNSPVSVTEVPNNTTPPSNTMEHKTLGNGTSAFKPL